MAWLGATPVIERKQAIAGSQEKPLTRLQTMRKDRKDPEYAPAMPDASDAPYVLEYLWSVGPTLVSGMGPGPLTFGELTAWQDGTGIPLNAWELMTLRRLSVAYLQQAQDAKSPECPSPLAPPEMSEKEREHVADKIEAFFGNFMNKDSS